MVQILAVEQPSEDEQIWLFGFDIVNSMLHAWATVGRQDQWHIFRFAYLILKNQIYEFGNQSQFCGFLLPYSLSCILHLFQIDSHVKRLDEDLNYFAEDLKQEGKIAPDEPAILPPLPIVPKSDKRKPFYGTPQPKRLDYSNREWDRERDRDFELMPPPGSHKKEFAAPMDVEQPIDPNEPTYCVCHQVSFGDMIACDNENCQGGEWFHYSCVGLTPETRFKGKWYCPTCRMLPQCQ
ncbi:PHD finger protein ING2 [Quercus suber]|uniref:PHD finger protein ING2 n=1 Tax=Quercus suber TaxID=58331 RepID=UPI0032DF4F76